MPIQQVLIVTQSLGSKLTFNLIMLDTLRDAAPGPKSTAAPIMSTETGAEYQSTGTTTTDSISGLNQPASYSTTTANNSTSTYTTAPSTTTSTTTAAPKTSASRNEEQTFESSSQADVISRLQQNVQASVKETTGRNDPDVAEDLGDKSVGKKILEGLGLGGDERKTTLRSVDDA